MPNAHIFLVILSTIILIIFAEYQKLRQITWILTIGCITYLFLIITPDNNNINEDQENNTIQVLDTVQTKSTKNEVSIIKEELVVPKLQETPIISENELKTETVIKSPTTLGVNYIAIATEIIERDPIGVGNLFLSDISELYCHTSIDNPFNNNKIVHIWQKDEQDYLRSYLSVGESSNWRCWSKITVNSDMVGDWKVLVSDTTGNILDSIMFTVLPNQE